MIVLSVVFLKGHDLTYNGMAIMASFTTNGSCYGEEYIYWQCSVITNLFRYSDQTCES